MKKNTIKMLNNRLVIIMKMHDKANTLCALYGRKLQKDLDWGHRYKYQSAYAKYHKIRERLYVYYAEVFTRMAIIIVESNAKPVTPPMSLSLAESYLQETAASMEDIHELIY